MLRTLSYLHYKSWKYALAIVSWHIRLNFTGDLAYKKYCFLTKVDFVTIYRVRHPSVDC